MTGTPMTLFSEEVFAKQLGARLIEDADKLRRFMPEHEARIQFTWAGRLYRVVLTMEDNTDDL